MADEVGEVGVVVSGSTMASLLPSVVLLTMYIYVSPINEEGVVVTAKVRGTEAIS